MSKKKLTPIEANTISKTCKLPRDNVSTDEWWMLTDGLHVTICEQMVGSQAENCVRVPKKVFDAFARWYMTGKWRCPRPACADAAIAAAPKEENWKTILYSWVKTKGR
jgi:hypothetical protein